MVGSLSSTAWLSPRLPSVSLGLYFIISVLGSLLFCLGYSWSAPSPLLCCLGPLLLLGYCPFHFWVPKVLLHIDILSLLLFLGPIKFGYLYLLLITILSFWWLVFLPFFVGLLLLYSTGALSLIIYSSGSVQLFILIFMDSSFFVLYYSIYLLRLFVLALPSTGLISLFMAMLFLIGIPPLGMF